MKDAASLWSIGAPEPGDALVAGVDGCRGGWVVVLAVHRGEGRQPSAMAVRLCASFAEVLERVTPPAIIAVDLPIGLTDRFVEGGRACDRDARKLLGPGWTSSVFSPPARSALEATDHAEAMQRQGGGLSIQSFNIAPRIREADALLTPELQSRVFEAHPELAFRQLNAGGQLTARKHTEPGRRERIRLVREVFGDRLPDAMAARRQLGVTAVGIDDVLDACVLAHVAWRIRCREAWRVPAAEPARDARGLRMEIWF
jgi:predicted RNase H-like nuclease